MPLHRAVELASPPPLLEITSGKVGCVSAVSISWHSSNHKITTSGRGKGKKERKKITHKTEKAAQSQVPYICRGPEAVVQEDMKQSHSANGHTRPHNATAAKCMSG